MTHDLKDSLFSCILTTPTPSLTATNELTLLQKNVEHIVLDILILLIEVSTSHQTCHSVGHSDGRKQTAIDCDLNTRTVESVAHTTTNPTGL